jgi:hypothetical protein
MADQHLNVFTRRSFPQVFSSAIDQMIDRMVRKPQLSTCDYEDAFCDCREKAVVHDLGTDFEYCVRHFIAVTRQAVSRG